MSVTSQLLVRNLSQLMGTHAYCDVCDAIQPVAIEPLDQPDVTGRFRGGDVMCSECGFDLHDVRINRSTLCACLTSI
jgi:hypothetical protein